MIPRQGVLATLLRSHNLRLILNGEQARGSNPSKEEEEKRRRRKKNHNIFSTFHSACPELEVVIRLKPKFI
jgi:hypothetical protein